jgi:hypothetical protein
MNDRPRARPALAGALLLALASGCDTRVVELAGSLDAAAAMGMTCSEFVRADGVVCKLCFSANGEVTSAMCPDPAPTVPVMTAPATCQVTSPGDERCLLCSGGATREYTACLKCEPPIPRMTGGQCRICSWSDDPNTRCLQCVTRDLIRDEDSCDALRREPVIYPMGAPDAGSGA